MMIIRTAGMLEIFKDNLILLIILFFIAKLPNYFFSTRIEDAKQL